MAGAQACGRARAQARDGPQGAGIARAQARRRVTARARAGGGAIGQAGRRAFARE
ncbi:hypothetical protein GCM10023334_123130 [Nonomuraea thailandensis]